MNMIPRLSALAALTISDTERKIMIDLKIRPKDLDTLEALVIYRGKTKDYKREAEYSLKKTIALIHELIDVHDFEEAKNAIKQAKRLSAYLSTVNKRIEAMSAKISVLAAEKGVDEEMVEAFEEKYS